MPGSLLINGSKAIGEGPETPGKGGIPGAFGRVSAGIPGAGASLGFPRNSGPASGSDPAFPGRNCREFSGIGLGAGIPGIPRAAPPEASIPEEFPGSPGVWGNPWDRGGESGIWESAGAGVKESLGKAGIPPLFPAGMFGIRPGPFFFFWRLLPKKQKSRELFVLPKFGALGSGRGRGRGGNPGGNRSRDGSGGIHGWAGGDSGRDRIRGDSGRDPFPQGSVGQSFPEGFGIGSFPCWDFWECSPG